MKVCAKCRVLKPVDFFSLDRSTSDGFRSYCRDCAQVYWGIHRAKNKEKLNQKAREYRAKDPSKVRRSVRRSALKTKYRLTEIEFNQLVLKQGNRCAICSREFLPGVQIDVDHVHESNPIKVRGLLCSNCNNGIGRFKDSPEFLQNAIDYLISNS